jgi:hypothetical protein
MYDDAFHVETAIAIVQGFQHEAVRHQGHHP